MSIFNFDQVNNTLLNNILFYRISVDFIFYFNPIYDLKFLNCIIIENNSGFSSIFGQESNQMVFKQFLFMKNYNDICN